MIAISSQIISPSVPFSILPVGFSEPELHALLSGIVATTVTFLPFAVIASPISVSLSRKDIEKSTGGVSDQLAVWFGLGWFLFFLLVAPITLFDRFGLVSPFLIVALAINFVRMDFERDEGEPFLAVVLALASPLLLLLYGLVSVLEYGVRRVLDMDAGSVIARPAALDWVVGNWWLVTILGILPVIVILVDNWRYTLGHGEWTVDGYDDREVPSWVPALPLFLSLLLLVATVIVPVSLYATLGTYSPIVLLLYGIAPLLNALDGRGLRRRCLNYSLVVPAAVVCALIEYDLRAFWFG